MNLTQTLRPLSLKEIVGHEKIVKELSERSKKRDFPQVSFFVGITGIGKTTLQRIIAKNILCQNTDADGNSCNICNVCISIQNEKPLINFFEYDGYDLNIEVIRNIEDLASKKISFEKTNKKVFIIDELQALTRNPQALKKTLKFLERPYKDVYFLLGAMEYLKLPEAIKNRTVMYKLNPIPALDIARYLDKYCTANNIQIDDEKAKILIAIGESCNGSIRTAVSILETVIYRKIWTEEELASQLSLFTNAKLNHFVTGMLHGDISILSESSSVLSEENKVTEEVLDSIRNRLNAVYKFKSGIELSPFLKSELTGIDANVSIEVIEIAIMKLNELLKYLYISPSLIEFSIINIINACKKISVSRPSRVPKGSTTSELKTQRLEK